jgi:pseudaminic acid biosynthesis-associated methylase
MADRPANAWSGGFGREYTDRNTLTIEELDALYRRSFGVSRRELNQGFLSAMPRSLRILEVGTNLGNQILLLREMGFRDLVGVEVQRYALEKSRARAAGLPVVQGSGAALPFRDAAFDMVFTSGVLIHIPPTVLGRVLSEIHRCAKTWIWGYEYYSPEPTEVVYRGQRGLLWKADFSRLYREAFPDLETVREERLRYLDSPNEDAMFLLRKGPP